MLHGWMLQEEGTEGKMCRKGGRRKEEEGRKKRNEGERVVNEVGGFEHQCC